jgi:hypothetical protein
VYGISDEPMTAEEWKRPVAVANVHTPDASVKRAPDAPQRALTFRCG